MNPLRLIILIFLFYLLFRLLKGGFTKKGRKKAKGSAASSANLPRDVLVEDPVCKTYIPKGQALSFDKDGVLHYFCSEKCRKIFQEGEGGTE